MAINQRFWIASAVFFYGAIYFIVYQKKTGLLVAFFSLLIHFGMLVPLFTLIVFFFFGKRDLSYLIFFAISILFSGLNIDFISPFLAQISPAFQESFEVYTSEGAYFRYQERFVEGTWFMRWRTTLLITYLLVTLLLVYFKQKSKIPNKFFGLFCFVILFSSVLNFINEFPMIYRYQPMFIVFGLAFLYFINLSTTRIKLKTINNIGVPFLLLYSVVQVRMLFGSVSAIIFFSNPILELFISFETSIWDIISKFIS